MSVGETLYDPLLDHFIGQLPARPVGDRPPVRLGRLAGEGEDLAPLLGSNRVRTSRTRAVAQPIHHGLKAPFDPAPGPDAHIRLVDAQRVGNCLITQAFTVGQQDDAGPSGDLLRRAVRADQLFKNRPLRRQKVDAVVVQHAADIPRAGGVLIQRLWLAGLGRFDLSKSGALLDRTLFDHAVWQPERLDFCGGADCQPPLVQQLPAPEPFNVTAAPADTRSTLPDLSLAERTRLAALKDELRTAPALIERLQAVRSAWIGERVEEALARHPEDDPGQVEQRYRAAIIERRLMGDFPIVLADGKEVTVATLLDQPAVYHNQRCADPLDPGYRRDRRVAWINLRNAGRPYIFSHAHGGQRFILHRASQTLRVIKGELHTRVARILELMALDGSVFDRGGELVRVAEGGQVYAVTPEWLTVHLSGYIRFEVFDARAGEWRPADCPLDLAKRVLAMQGAYGLPRLRAVITAPILTLDGRMLEQDGHDPASGLLLMQDQPDHALVVPSAPGPAELHEAMAELWHPFKDFPFVGPVDRGVMLAALLTAVMRPVLPTAPGFLFAAPTAGSGKTLIALCLSLLMGADPPALMPPTMEEEELRKRLLAALREGRPALVFDNVCGHLDSAALCAFLTAREYGDRVLGSSLTVFVPATALFSPPATTWPWSGT